MPDDPFDEERKRKRLLDDAMGGSVARFFQEDAKRRKLIDDAMGGAAQRYFHEEQQRRELFEQSTISKSVQDLFDRQKEQNRLFQPSKSNAVQRYFDAEKTRRETLDFGSLASTKAFQENVASAIAAAIEPYSKLSKSIMKLGVFDRIAQEQSALINAISGIDSHVYKALQGAIPDASRFAASIGVQSALAGTLRNISDQFSDPSSIASMRRIQDTTVWDSLRDTYDLDDHMSVSQAFLEIGAKLDQSDEQSRSFDFAELWQLIQFLFLVYSAYVMIAGSGDYTANDRARDEDTARRVERIEIQEQMQKVESAIAQASALAEMARVNELPRALVRTAANVRSSPTQKGERIARLEANTVVAIEGTDGRWLRVIFSDSLTQELAEGWMWRDSVELMTAP